jgi:predicted chitinase
MPGEIVMNRAAVKGIGADKLLALNAQYGGSNANKPKYSSNIQFAADGGMIGASKSTNTPTLSPIEIKFASRARQRGITDPTELKAFLSQVKHESGGFGAPKREKYNSSPNDPPGKPGYEYFKGYANPKLGLGNLNADDAYNYMGRGYLQITGRANYDDIGRKIGKNLVDNPQLMMNSDVALDASIEYWKSRVRPMVGNNWNNVFEVSRAINKPAAVSPSEIVGMKDRQQTFQKYNQIPNKTIASLTAPRPKPTSTKKPGFLQNLSQNFSNFLFNNQPAYAKKMGGGLIKENTGMNIAGASADRQLTALQPGEYVLPADTVSKLGTSLIDKLVAMTDGNSTAAKLGKRSGRYTPGPLSRAGRGGMMTLPPISQSAGGSMGAPASGTSIPSFSAVSPSGGAERSMNASIYGIVG